MAIINENIVNNIEKRKANLMSKNQWKESEIIMKILSIMKNNNNNSYVAKQW